MKEKLKTKDVSYIFMVVAVLDSLGRKLHNFAVLPIHLYFHMITELKEKVKANTSLLDGRKRKILKQF